MRSLALIDRILPDWWLRLNQATEAVTHDIDKRFGRGKDGDSGSRIGRADPRLGTFETARRRRRAASGDQECRDRRKGCDQDIEEIVNSVRVEHSCFLY